jgi:uncharacterized membrane protein
MSRLAMPGGSLLWVLLVSIALNLFFGGWLGARAARDQWATAPQPTKMRIEELAGTLPAADGALLRQSFATDGEEIAAARTTFHDAQEAVRKSLRAQPFDAAAFETATATMRERRVVLEVALHRALLRAAAKMSSEGRVALSQWPPQH